MLPIAVDAAGWHRIDKHEVAAGAAAGPASREIDGLAGAAWTSRRAADGPIVASRSGGIRRASCLKIRSSSRLCAGRRARFRRARRGANHAQGHAAFGSQDRRSDLDHGADLHPSRLHGLRHAVRARRQARGQAADGRQVGGLARQAHLDLHPARRPGMARRQAGDGRGLRRLDQALGRQGFDGPEADGRGRPSSRRPTPRPSRWC